MLSAQLFPLMSRQRANDYYDDDSDDDDDDDYAERLFWAFYFHVTGFCFDFDASMRNKQPVHGHFV